MGKKICDPHDLKLDSAGNIYVTDEKCSRIYKITPGGVKTVLAGSGKEGYQDGAAAQAQFNHPHGIAVDPQGLNVYVGDSINGRVRKITDGRVSTLASGFVNPQNLAVDGSGNIYVSDVGKGLKKITPTGEVALVTNLFHSPRGVWLSPGGILYVADNSASKGSNVVLKILLSK